MHKQQPKQRLQTAIARSLLAVTLLIPVAVYVSKFGFAVSSDHVRWSEFGSAMGGIYTPVLALLTLAMLILQLQLQGLLNKHTFDSAYVQDARADLNFFYEHLLAQLEAKFHPGATVREALVERFAYKDNAWLQGPAARDAARELSQRAPRLQALWQGANAIFAGLSADDDPPYTTARSSGRSKAIALFGFEGCVALDNLCWAGSDGRLAYSVFSEAVATAALAKANG